MTVAGGTGNDTVVLTNTQLGYFGPGSLNLYLGGGTDKVQLPGLSTIKGGVWIASPNGSLDLQNLTNAKIQGNLDVRARQVTKLVCSQSNVGGWLWVATDPTNTATGADSITIDSCGIGGDLKVQTGTNYQYLNVNATTVSGNVDVSGDRSDTFIATGSTFQGGLVVDFSTAPSICSATIQLTQTTVKQALNITTGAGDDTVTLKGDPIGQANPNAVATINTGGGNDSVDLSGSTFSCNARFDGGPGTDTLHKGGARFLALPPVILDFEKVS